VKIQLTEKGEISFIISKMLLILEETAKGKVLKKMRKIKNELFDLDYSPRPP